MRAYTWLWCLAALPALAALCLLGLALAPTSAVIAGVLTAAAAGALASIFEWADRHHRSSRPARRTVRWALVSGAGGGVLVATVSVLGALTLPCLLVAGLTTPPVVRRLGRELRTSPHAMSDADLCRAWRSSTTALHASRAPHEQLALATRRQAYLDEIEHRNKEGLQAWLEAGASAEEAMDAFVVRPRRSSS